MGGFSESFGESCGMVLGCAAAILILLLILGGGVGGCVAVLSQ